MTRLMTFALFAVGRNTLTTGKYMKYLMYELEMMEDNGNVVHFYKAVKFTRIIRLPKSAKQSESFMDMHGQVLAAVWERNIKLLTVIANLLHPVALGLLYIYGVQGVSQTPEDAKEDCRQGLHRSVQRTAGNIPRLRAPHPDL